MEGAKVNFCIRDTKNIKSVVRATDSPKQFRFPIARNNTAF